MISAGTNTTLSGTCGVGLFASFNGSGVRGGWNYGEPLNNIRPYGGAGWQVAGFVKTSVCKEAYEVFKSKYNIVFQAPVRRNSNSGNQFFMCLYDTKRRAPRPSWKGQRSGAPKPQALIDWEAAPPLPIDNSAHAWPWRTT